MAGFSHMPSVDCWELSAPHPHSSRGSSVSDLRFIVGVMAPLNYRGESELMSETECPFMAHSP